MRATLRAAALGGALILSLSGCGIKGPLYLPTTPATTSPATAGDHNKAPTAPTDQK